MSEVRSRFRMQGLGIWNLYFLSKFVLLWMGKIQLNVPGNVFLLVLLLVPLQKPWMRNVRLSLAVPFAIALYYHDTWWPPFSRVLAGGNDLRGFSSSYLMELMLRVLDWQVIGALLTLTLVWWWLRPWLRMTTISAAGMLVFSAGVLSAPAFMRSSTLPLQHTGLTQEVDTDAGDPTVKLDAALADFFQDQAIAHTEFPSPSTTSSPFDVLVLNVCSLAWSDLKQVGMHEHRLFEQMDVLFENFNSATSYSGPAGIRLLRASCGQSPHTALYEPARDECYLFDNLQRLGFDRAVEMNHSGAFQGYTDSLSTYGRVKADSRLNDRLGPTYLAFDGVALPRDADVLGAWWQQRLEDPGKHVALFYNSITTHDGNRLMVANGKSVRSDFKSRAQMLLEDIEQFMRQIEASGRRAMVILVPEHGAALHGDRLQIPGMREFPSPAITHVPVGIKFIGMPEAAALSRRRVGDPVSYLALSEVIARTYRLYASGSPDPDDKQSLTEGLPVTPAVSENEGSVVMQQQGGVFMRLGGERKWSRYPETSQ